MKEIWKDIKGYEGLYEVSNFGNVRSISWRNTNEVKNLYLKHHPKGYYQVELSKNHKKKMHLVHRLVAETFIHNPNNLPIINHKDENKMNNKVENLEWCTHSYNSRYSFNGGRIIDIPVVQIRLDEPQKTITHSSLYELCKERNWRTSSIKECCDGKRKTAYGFIWQYAD